MNKKWKKKIAAIFLVLTLVIIAVSSSIGNRALAASKKKQTISVDNDYYVKTIGEKSFNLNAKAKTKLSYKTSDKNVVSVSKNGKVTIKNVGSATITIKASSNKKYKSASVSVDIYVASKASKANMVSLILNDSTIIPAGSSEIIPLSKLKDASFEITNRQKGMSYLYTSIVSAGDYYVEEDPSVNWAYEGIAIDMSNSKLVKKWDGKYDYWELKDVEKSIMLSDYVITALSELEYYDTLCIELQEIKADGYEGTYYYENNFRIDRTK